MFDHPAYEFRRWVKHTASVPKGFLRYYVLRLIKEKPMSGSEIMEEIRRETDGQWKPSPGSVYPLLAWLQSSGYIKEEPAEENGIKRYMLTENSKKFLEEQEKLREKIQGKLEFIGPMMFRFFLPPNLQELREPVRRLARALFDFRKALGEEITEEALKEVAEFLNNTALKIEDVNRNLKERNRMGKSG